MSLDNLRLRTKIAIPVALMGAVILAIVAYGAVNLSRQAASMGDLVERRTQGELSIFRSRANVTAMGYALLAEFVIGEPGADTKSAKLFSSSLNTSMARFDEAAKYLPERAADIASLKARLQRLADAAQKPLQIAQQSPALTNGSKLKPAELDAMGEGARAVVAIDGDLQKYSDELRTFGIMLHDEDVAAATALQAGSRFAISALAIFGLGAAALSAGAAMWLASAKIAKPLTRLGAAMAKLAGGDTGIEVEGVERRDEVGEMSRAVEVFKHNALERARLEGEAAAERARADAERARAEEERARTAREVGEAVRRLGDALRSMADGDLTQRLRDGFSAAYAQLRDDFNGAAERLKTTVAEVKGSAGTLATSAQEIKGSADDLSRRTEGQASSLEQSSAALTEVTATVQQSAEGAKRARVLVERADAQAKSSESVVEKTVAAMTAISQSSQEIGQIIGVIDEIAFQTNLLALNAGVEAARAGEAGRGFAVVASEVRALAQRSAEAAKHIKDLISASDEHVRTGVALVGDTGKALTGIAGSVAEINAVIAGIASASQEQATALHEVTAAIEQMSAATQQNAAMVEESNAAGQVLSQESERLAQLVGQFNVGAAPLRRAA